MNDKEKKVVKSKKVLIADLLEKRKDDSTWLELFTYSRLERGWTVAQLQYELDREV